MLKQFSTQCATPALLLGAASLSLSTSAGTFNVNPFANGLDSSTGISTSPTYTHLVDVNKDSDTAVINGVTFDNTLANYTLTGPNRNFTNYNSPADNASGLEVLLQNFRYTSGTGPATSELILSGLTPGVQYKLRLYIGGYGGNNQTYNFDDGAGFSFPNVSRGLNGTGSIDYTYTLGTGDTDLEVNITRQASGSFHFYGFSNEVVPEPTSLALLSIGGLLIARRRRV